MKKLFILIGICVMAGNIFGQDIEGDNVYVRYNIFLRDSIIAGSYSGFLSDTNDVNSRIKTFRDTITFNASDTVTYALRAVNADTARISDTSLYVVGLEKDSSWVSTRTGNATSYTTIDYSGIKNYNDDEGLYLGSHLYHGGLKINHPTIPNTYTLFDYNGLSFHGLNKNRRLRFTADTLYIEHGLAGSEVSDLKIDTTGTLSVEKISLGGSAVMDTTYNMADGIPILRVTQVSGALTDGAPTQAQLNATIGETASAKGAGYQVTVKDTNGSGLLYKCESDGTDWYYIAMTKSL